MEFNQNNDVRLIQEIENINRIIGEIEYKLDEPNGVLKNEIKNRIKPYESFEELFLYAVKKRKVFNQINDLIHAYGIISHLPKVLDEDERVLKLSLGPDTSRSKFDLVTSKKICEFKFHSWDNGSNAARKKQLIKDYINLLLIDGDELYEGKMRVIYLPTEKDLNKATIFLKGRANVFKNITTNQGELFEKFIKDFDRKYTVIGNLYEKYLSKIELKFLI